MKKMKSIIAAILLTTIFFFPLGQTVEASEIQETTAPVFMLLATKDGESYAMSAFYIEDTPGTGSTYLVTSSMTGSMKENGYELYIGKNGYAQKIEEVYTKDNITYLQADDLAGTAPLTMTEFVITYNPAVVYLETENGVDFTMKSEPVDLENWAVGEGCYFQGETMENIRYLGAPVFDATSTTVMGMIHVDDENETVMMDLTQVDFPEEKAIVVGDKIPEEDDTDAQQVLSKEQIIIGVIGAIVLVLIIVGLMIQQKRNSKSNPKSNQKNKRQSNKQKECR